MGVAWTFFTPSKRLAALRQAERIIAVLKSLELPVFHPLLTRRTKDGACEILKGLEAFREHLGGHLTVLMLTGIGKGMDVHEIDAALMEECIREMQVQAASAE